MEEKSFNADLSKLEKMPFSDVLSSCKTKYCNLDEKLGYELTGDILSSLDEVIDYGVEIRRSRRVKRIVCHLGTLLSIARYRRSTNYQESGLTTNVQDCCILFMQELIKRHYDISSIQ